MNIFKKLFKKEWKIGEIDKSKFSRGRTKIARISVPYTVCSNCGFELEMVGFEYWKTKCCSAPNFNSKIFKSEKKEIPYDSVVMTIKRARKDSTGNYI